LRAAAFFLSQSMEVHDMAARKKKAAKKAAKKATRKAKRTVSKAKKATKKAAKKRTKAAAKRVPAKKTKKSTRKIKGEGDYAASRAFLKDQSGFVVKNKAKIPAMGKEAEKALEGPEGAELREAEAIAAARSRDTF
jgi:hypothetical protein